MNGKRIIVRVEMLDDGGERPRVGKVVIKIVEMGIGRGMICWRCQRLGFSFA